jgi:hypothetical protein
MARDDDELFPPTTCSDTHALQGVVVFLLVVAFFAVLLLLAHCDNPAK